jgi:hypothetical protein
VRQPQPREDPGAVRRARAAHRRALRAAKQGDHLLYYLEHRRCHADSETRRKLAESMVYSLEEAYTFYTAMGAAARKHMSDKK